MLMPSIFGEDLFDDWMRLPVERENHKREPISPCTRRGESITRDSARYPPPLSGPYSWRPGTCNCPELWTERRAGFCRCWLR